MLLNSRHICLPVYFQNFEIKIENLHDFLKDIQAERCTEEANLPQTLRKDYWKFREMSVQLGYISSTLMWVFDSVFSYDYSPYIFCLQIILFKEKPAMSGTLTQQWANAPFPALPLSLV